METQTEPSARPASLDFIRAKIAEDLKKGKYRRPIMTRFPPEPNGYLHIGHAKSICLNFGIADEHEGGVCNLRFDDTNPITEEEKYAQAIQDDVRWLGYDWGDRLYYASDYFEQFYEFAVKLVKDGKAYVDSLNEEQIREYRGTVTEAGRESPYRDRSVRENLDLLERMRAGEFPNGAHVLRARINMAAQNMLLRDPLLYRIRHASHYRTGNGWCVYPMYDYAHCLEDAIEGVTHSLCTLEFKDNRALYDWVLQNVGFEEPPEQTEFARLNLDYTVLSKRKLIRLVEEGHVEGWDDPRMPTIAGLRRRGVTPAAIRSFCDMIGVAKVDSRVDIGKLEYAIRDHLNRTVPRVLCVLRPLKVVIENYPPGETEWLEAPYYPHDVPKEGSRSLPFSRELYVERDDFMENPPKQFFRLGRGREVRLRYAYYITCRDVIKNPDTGEIQELRCTYDPETKGGGAPDGRKVKGTIHWVSASHAIPVQVRLYERLFSVPNPDDVPEGGDFTDHLNPQSVVILDDSRIEPSVGNDRVGSRYQFERQGYFISDPTDSTPQRLAFNRTVALRDTWAKLSTRVADSAPVRDVEPVPAAEPTVSKGHHDKPGAVERGGTEEFRARVSRYVGDMELADWEAEVIASNRKLAAFFEEAVAAHRHPRTLANWVLNEVQRESRGRAIEDLPFSSADLAELVALISEGAISHAVARSVFSEMARGGGPPREIVRARRLEQGGDETALRALVDRVLADHPSEVQRYRSGKTSLLSFFVGQVMQQSGRKADPVLVKELLQSKLE